MIRGALFSRYYLEDGIRETPAYRTLNPVHLTAFTDTARGLWRNLEGMTRPNEAETEAEFIFPILNELGWHHLPQQEPGRGRRDIADALLFLTDGAKDRARRLPKIDRFRHGVVVVENEARDTPLDRASGTKEAPSSQILRYLSRADTQSDGAVAWGLLTTGGTWRLYWAKARDRAKDFIELDFAGLIGNLPPAPPAGAPPDHWLRVFLLLFHRDALEPHGPQSRNFLDEAVAEGRRYEARVTAQLSRIVFDKVFPDLVAAIARHDPRADPASTAWRADIREAALRLLYRLLFLLYAEDRDLLPVRDPGYTDYSLQSLRNEAAAVADAHKTLSSRAVTWWPKLRALFNAIADGDTTLALPPYNGSLFRDDAGTLLTRLALPDAILAPLIDAMSREGEALARRWINYRDLDVQHLGSIYERLLERDVVPDGEKIVALRPNAFARKTTGSYYTPDELVQLILRRAVGPLLAERRAAFSEYAEKLAADTRRKPERLADLARHDAAQAFLALRIVDPAMGSGHFLVSLVDYLTNATLEAIAEAPQAVAAWGEYRSPVMQRVEAIRAHIKQQAAEGGWPVRDDQLDDQHIIRRIILKRCVYGVDLNPMAVELAKLSLWLHSFTVGAPLSFLDHHLRCGDSLFGEFAGPVERDLRTRFGLVMSGAIVSARQAASGMALVEEQTDADIAGVNASAAGFASVEQDTAPLRAFLDFYHAARWLADDPDPAAEAGREAFFGGNYGDPVALAAGAPLKPPKSDSVAIARKRGRPSVTPADAHAAASRFVERARALAAERRFFHWEAAFPGVWDEWERQPPIGGFDAAIGNPPWDRMKMQEVEWFAARVPHVALNPRASHRKAAVQALRRACDPIAVEYDHAAWTAEAAIRVARDSGSFPLLSGGDVNIYALMVERAARIVRPDGIVGLLVPSGIAADLGAAPFFRSISTTGRLAALLDFENGRRKPEPFFPDVHRSFKFCSLTFGGEDRVFPSAECAFFNESAAAAEQNAFALAPADFDAVNPNTGTAPIFRSPRDAEITKTVYSCTPVLTDRRAAKPRQVWPMRYVRMFDMTNDSAKFRTEEELRKLGAYELATGGWAKGVERWLPLYEGKMVQAFDHRAASVVVNVANTHRPAQPETTGDLLHADPKFRSKPQFWVLKGEVDEVSTRKWSLALKHVSAPTNIRTVIVSICPTAGFGNSLPILLDRPITGEPSYAQWAPILCGNLNAIALDFIARSKLQGQNLNLFVIEQLPIISQTAYKLMFGNKSAETIIREDVLALTYTAHDLDAFAADMGHTGPPFKWNPEDRLRRRARLDALFFILYGLDQTDAEYVINTFPILREQEIAAYGTFRTRTLVLNMMAALKAGHPEAQVAG